MKKSTLTACIAVIGAIATLASTNLKLKSEYSKGNIRNPYTITPLAGFKYIKVVFDSTSRSGEEFRINISKGAVSSIGTYFDERAKLLSRVSHDTLIITNDPLDKEHHSLRDVVIITSPGLKGISVTKGSYMISQDDTDSLSVTANDASTVNLKLNKINKLIVKSAHKAAITVSSKDTINEASIQLNDQSVFTANDIVIKQKTLQLGNAASLHLRGRSIKNFSVQ